MIITMIIILIGLIAAGVILNQRLFKKDKKKDETIADTHTAKINDKLA